MWSSTKKPLFAIVNADDHYGRKLQVADHVIIWTYGQLESDFRYKILKMDYNHTEFELVTPADTFLLKVPLSGAHMISNCVASLIAALTCGVSIEQSLRALNLFKGVPGRLQKINSSEGKTVFVDYAHTPDALENVLKSLVEIRTKNQVKNKIITVFGCGGDRDKSKRPLMAQFAAKYSDSVFVTSDNPRTEAPEAIIEEIKNGIPLDYKTVTFEVDREKAIAGAIRQAGVDDVILIAGKGHEDYQIIGAEKFHFSDAEVAQKYLQGIAMKWNLEQIATWACGEIISRHVVEFNQVGTDTRSDLKGQIFIALKGENYDAHDYLDQAVKQGAALLLIHRLDAKFESLKSQVSIVLVKDTLQALQDFSHQYRKSISAKIIGITGSNGKTTTKEFAAQILGSFKKTHYNQGSFNNHWGVPLTLLQIENDVEFAVVEMGMNHAGEIKRLVEIAEPDLVVCTMVGTAHIEFFGTIKKIAEAKQEIYLNSKPETIRIFNQDQELTFDMMYPSAKAFPASRMLSFSDRNNKADVYLHIDELSMKDMKLRGVIAGVEDQAVVPIFGKQNLVNLMAACAIAHACKMPAEKIWKALVHCHTSWGRNQFLKTQSGAEILFDGYNANPDSMMALLENIPLLKVPGKKIGVFGQMKELGLVSEDAHRKIGAAAAAAGFSHIFFIGEDYKFFSKGIKSSSYAGVFHAEPEFNSMLGKMLQEILKAGDVVTVKGSRGAATERFVEYCQPLNWVQK